MPHSFGGFNAFFLFSLIPFLTLFKGHLKLSMEGCDDLLCASTRLISTVILIDFNPLNNPMRWILLSYSCTEEEPGASRGQVIQLTTSKARVRTQG